MNYHTHSEAVPILKWRGLWLTIGWGFVGLVVYLSLTPDPPQTDVPHGMKIGHCLAYAWLMLWFAQIVRPAAQRRRIAWALAALGILLEFAQGLTDYRGFEFSDMVINAGGAVLGLVLARPPIDGVLAWIEHISMRGGS
jgi:VanZ family protein